MTASKFVEKVSPDGYRYEVADMGHQFKGYVSNDGGGAGIDAEAIAEAERALSGLSAGFSLWLDEEVEALCAAHDAWRESPGETEQRERLFRKAFDLCGMATTLGQPLITEMATTLALLLEQTLCEEEQPTALIDAHVASIRAALAKRGNGSNASIGKELAAALHKAAHIYLERADLLPEE